MPKIKINKELYKKVKHVSEIAGYSSVYEFISHLLEKAVDQTSPEENDEDVLKRLQGLGYIS
jgi:metal-responsive CopG/Arc/MetJ family transcriptional regulator